MKTNIKHSFNSFFKFTKKNMFLKTNSPLINTGNSAELSIKDETDERIYKSRKTYTKWFNPNNFDPRAPDYINSVRGLWEENATREDIGSGKYLFNEVYLNFYYFICLI